MAKNHPNIEFPKDTRLGIAKNNNVIVSKIIQVYAMSAPVFVLRANYHVMLQKNFILSEQCVNTLLWYSMIEKRFMLKENCQQQTLHHNGVYCLILLVGKFYKMYDYFLVYI